MKDLENITLHYKNLEKVFIEPKHLIDLNIYGITTRVQSVGDTHIEKQEEAEYLILQVEEFDSEKSNKQSVLYSDISPYEKVTQDTTVESITFHYKEEETEEVHVPYRKKDDTKEISENDLLRVKQGTFEVLYSEPRVGVELEFNPEEKPY